MIGVVSAGSGEGRMRDNSWTGLNFFCFVLSVLPV